MDTGRYRRKPSPISKPSQAPATRPPGSPAGSPWAAPANTAPDYFFRNNRPKKLWLRVLHRNTGPMLCGIEMPSQYTAGLNFNSPERALPLRAKQL